MNRSTPGLPVHHHLLEFTQTHVHRVSDAIQPSHPRSSPSPPAPSPSQHQSFPMSQLFTWGGQSTGALALASFLPKKSQGWSPSEWTGWISWQSKGLSINICPWIHKLFTFLPWTYSFYLDWQQYLLPWELSDYLSSFSTTVCHLFLSNLPTVHL